MVLSLSLEDRFPPQLVAAVGEPFETMPVLYGFPVDRRALYGDGSDFRGIDRLFIGAIKGTVEAKDCNTRPFMAVHVRAKDPSRASKLDTCVFIFQRFIGKPEQDVDDSPEQDRRATNYRVYAFSKSSSDGMTGTFLGNTDMPLNRSALEGIQRLFAGTDPDLRLENRGDVSASSFPT